MSEHQPSDRQSAIGERRRRREAERAAREAAERSGMVQPLTRRELRRRQLEEQARLEAIATGELPLLDDRGNPLDPAAAAATAERAANGQVVVARPDLTQPGRTEPDRTESASAGPDRTESASAGADRAPAADTPSPGPRSAGTGTSPVSAASAASAASSATPATGMPSRRSLRAVARSADAAEAGPERPSERTGTGRRPVVRAPHTASGIRTVDSTGELTGVQPVTRPEPPPAPPQEEPEPTTDPGAWSAVATPPGSTGVPLPSAPSADRSAGEAGTGADVAPSPAQARGTDTSAWRSATSATSAERAGGRREPLTGPEAVAAAALSADEPQDTGERPRWSPLAEYSSSGPEETTPPERRSMRDRMGGPAQDAGQSRADDTADGGAPPPPAAPQAAPGQPAEGDAGAEPDGSRSTAASVVRIVALVLAAVIIGVLIGILATRSGSDGAAAASVVDLATPTSSAWSGTST